MLSMEEEPEQDKKTYKHSSKDTKKKCRSKDITKKCT